MGYIDLVLIHWPATGINEDKDLEPTDPKNAEDRHGTWKAMEEFVEAGRVKYIGVSNFTKPQLEKLLAVCKIRPVLN